MKFDLNTVLIIALIAWVALKDSCNPPEKPEPTVINYTPPPITVNIPPSKPTIIYKEIPANVDSSEVVRAYFSEARYQDTTQTDSIQIWVDEVVSRNQIQSRSVGFKYLFPPCSTVIMTPVVTRKVMVGLTATGNLDRITFMPTVGFQPKNGNLFTAGFNGSQVSVGYLHKIRVRN